MGCNMFFMVYIYIYFFYIVIWWLPVVLLLIICDTMLKLSAESCLTVKHNSWFNCYMNLVYSLLFYENVCLTNWPMGDVTWFLMCNLWMNTLYGWSSSLLLVKFLGVGGAVRFLVVGTIGKEERPPRGQLWMEQYLTSLKYWPIWYTIWSDPSYIWGVAILADTLVFSINNILAGLWLNCISSVEITLFLLADISLQHRAFSVRV